jgi:amino acid transporter
MSASKVEGSEALKREFTLGSAFTLAVVFISPIVALYGVFALVLMAAGPAGFWAFGVVLIGQLFVAGAFALLSSRWPFEGSVYQWARRLGGENYGWWTGWSYIWSLMIAVTGGAYFVAMFIPIMLNIPAFDPVTHTVVAIAVLILVTAINTAGPKAIKTFTIASLIAEVVGSIGLAIYLLAFHQNQPVEVLFDTAGTGMGDGGYLWAGFFAAVGFVGWAFVGFESAGAIAEEVKDAKRNVPKAIIFSLVTIGAIVLFSALALILSIPDIGTAVSGESIDPAADTIIAALGVGVVSPLFGLIIIGFLASMMAAQTSASRVIWSFSREGVFPAAKALSKLSSKNKYPINAIITAGAVSGLVLLFSLSGPIYSTLVSFSVAGFYVAFALPILALMVALYKGSWKFGAVKLKGWAKPVVTIAAAWAVFEAVNISWPRNPQLEWYQNYAVLIAVVVVAIVGLVIWSSLRKEIEKAGKALQKESNS